MGILKLIGLVGSGASIFSGIDVVLKHFSNSTAEDLFKRCLVNVVTESAPNLAHLTETRDSETVSVDDNTLDDVINSLDDIDISTLTSLGEPERLSEITTLFQDCIILPGHQLTSEELTHRIQPVIEKTIANFYSRLPRNQEASNQTTFEILKAQSRVQERLIEHAQENLDINSKFSSQLADLSNKHINVSVPDAVTAAVATEHQSAIDHARDLLKKGSPISALEYLEDLKQRIWSNASPIAKFRLLTNMAAAQLVFNEKQKAAMLLLEAFQHNPKDDIALSNRAAAHFLLGETEEAEVYAQKTLEQNQVNTHAYAILVEMSSNEETIEEVIDKVPGYLRATPEIAYAISNIAKQRQNLEEARKWGETMVEHEQEDIPDFKAALATILVEQVLDDYLAAFTEQPNDSQKEQLRRAIGLFTEAWNCIANTELRILRTDWILNRSTAHVHLGEVKAAIKDLNTALDIEPLNPVLLKNRAILAFKEGENKSAIEFLEKIESDSEIPEVPIILADILLAEKRFDEAIKTLNEFLATDPSSEPREHANRLLINIYIADERFEEAQQISTAMRESSSMSVLNLVDAARISRATGANDEALSQLKEAYNYAQDSEVFQEIMELANELYIYEQFEEAASLYEKLANTDLNSQLTQFLLNSYYHSGEREKTLKICQNLREKYGPLEKISEMEYAIYDEIGDMNQARVVCEAYTNKFPNDVDMKICLAGVYYRSNNVEELDRILERSFDSKNLSLPACSNLAYFYQITSRPKRALDIIYKARGTYYDDPDAHLKYVKLFYRVAEQIRELLHPTQVQPGTVVCLDSSGQRSRYFIGQDGDANHRLEELDVDHPLAQRLLGKTVSDEIHLQQTPVGTDIREIVNIRSKYVYARQESLRKFPELFPDNLGLWSMQLDDSHEADDSEKFQPLWNLIDQQHEVSLQIESAYKENLPPIGVFANWRSRDVLDTWIFLMSRPDLGVRCSSGNPEERSKAHTLLGDLQPTLVADLISLMTIYSLGAADAVIKAFGKLSIAQSTIDELQQIINDREGMWSQRESMSVGKQGDEYVRTIINPEDVRQDLERLKDIIKWIRENCEVRPCTPALRMNQLRRQELNDALQPLFLDTLLIASQPGNLLLSDDERLRFYATNHLNHEAGTNFNIEGVWTQVVLEHCVNRDSLNKAEYDEMTVKLVSLHYYQTVFNADLLIEAAKQSDWQLAEPYNSLVQALGGQRLSLSSALDVAANFLFKLWTQPILPGQSEYLTQALLAGLTSGRRTRIVLNQLIDRIQRKFPLYLPAEDNILMQIEIYAQKHPF